MCGIAGFSLAQGTSRVDQARVARALLLGIEPRGRDAAGIAWANDRDDDRTVWYQKHNVRASLLVDSLTPDGARALIAHTRYATQGDPKANVNNHPIAVPGLVGVHNGHIGNDREIFDLLACGRDGEVDSEAAMRLLAHGPAMWPGATPKELLALIEGTAALAWLVTDDEPGTLHLARLSYSPLVVATTRRGSLVFASTEDALRKAATAGGFAFRRIVHIPEGTYLKVEHGTVTEVQTDIYLPDGRKKAYDSTRVAKDVTTDYFTGDDEIDAIVRDWRGEYDDWSDVVDYRQGYTVRDMRHPAKPTTTVTTSTPKTKGGGTKAKRRHRKNRAQQTLALADATTEREPFPDYDPQNKAGA